MTSKTPSHLPRARVNELARCTRLLTKGSTQERPGGLFKSANQTPPEGGIGAMRPDQAIKALTSEPQEPPRILRMKQLELRVGIRRSSIYARLSETNRLYDPDFPKSVSLAPPSASKRRRKSAVGWIDSEVTAYLRLLSSRRT